MKKINKFDLQILDQMQQDGRISNQTLADRVGLSPAPCWRRVNRLQQEGYIHRYVALLNREKLGLGVMAYVHISLTDHHPQTLTEFDTFVEQCDCILECYSVSGEHDYLMRVIVASVTELEVFLMEGLLRLPAVRTANTSFVLKQKKYTTSLPIMEG